MSRMPTAADRPADAGRPCPTGGFTLIELLIVIMILGISAAVVVPLAVDARGLQATSAARIVTADLQHAQNTAIAFQEPVIVQFQTGVETYRLLDSTWTPLTHPITKDPYVVDFRSREGFTEVDIVSADFGGVTYFEYDEMGAPSDPGTVTIRSGSHVYTIDVAAATGKVTATGSGS